MGAPRTALVVVSDLDGTLLDAETYTLGAAEAVVRELREADVPLVLCSSKTRAEIESLMGRLGLDEPFICENGGALHVTGNLDAGGHRVPGGTEWRRVVLGQPYTEVVETLREAADAVNVRIRGFADMSVAEIARECGLEPLQAQLAKFREYDEPFRIVDADARSTASLMRALHARGLRTLEGGRYLHVVGGTDKGRAVSVLRESFAAERPVVLLGLGDAPNDVAMLKAVDVPVIVRRTDASVAQMARLVPDGMVTDQPGPAGWAAVVHAALGLWRDGQAIGVLRRGRA